MSAEMEAPEGCTACLICGVRNRPSNCPGNNDLSAAEALNMFLKQLGVPGHEISSKLRLCDGCFSGVSRATQWGEQVEEMKQDVQSRQEIILTMMGQLKSLEGNFLKEMRELERKIRKSKASIAAGLGSDNDDGSKGVEEISHGTTKAADTPNQGNLDGVMEPEDNDVPVPAASSLERSYVLSIPDNPNFLELPLFQEIDSFSFEEDSLSDNFVQDQDPLSTENLDVEDLLCSEVIPDDGSISMEEEELVTHSSDNAVDPLVEMVAEASMPKTEEQVPKQVDRKFGPCQHCGKKYATNYLLQVHIKTHTGERPFKCPMCSMAFVTKFKLNRHLVVHSEEKPFTCLQCNKGFKRKSGLKMHQRTHSDEKPFLCPVCGQGFKDKQWMKGHLKRKHPNNSAAPQ